MSHATATATFAETLAGLKDQYNGDSLEQAKAAFAEHQMTVLRSDGVYRHLRFATPGTGFYRFDIHTAPGLLTLTGDIGTFVFSRVPDMLSFFHSRYINLGYWAEKLLAPRTVTEYDEDLMRAALRREVEQRTGDWDEAYLATLWRRLEDEIEDVVMSHDLTIQTLMNFRYTNPQTKQVVDFPEAYEWHMTGYQTQFVLACHGLRAASLHYIATGGEVDHTG